MKASFTVPNILTVARIVMVAVGAWLGLAARAEALAVSLLIAAAVLDVFDGWYARTFASTTELGKHLDPFADKVLVTVIMVWLGMDARSMTVWWLVGASLAREAAMTVFRSYSARRHGRLIPASALGKLKMFLQCAGGLTILGITHFLGKRVPPPYVIGALAGMLVVSFWAMAGYIKAKGPAADHEQTHFALRSPG
ncbi:MAG TPA: CDP-alcohol phosphatidyltransferase family protein, partial [Candidatus Krumholzibacteria bacterium]|nr:CDP-alcohol phosphatidyltransferase family protein [Candidatus Krumholzibacteria bacterium]